MTIDLVSVNRTHHDDRIGLIFLYQRKIDDLLTGAGQILTVLAGIDVHDVLELIYRSQDVQEGHARSKPFDASIANVAQIRSSAFHVSLTDSGTSMRRREPSRAHLKHEFHDLGGEGDRVAAHRATLEVGEKVVGGELIADG